MAKKTIVVDRAAVVAHGCHNCTTWRRLPDEEQTPGEDVLGECRRYPPTVVVLADADAGPASMYPLVLAKDWCGEHETHVH